MGGDRIQHRVDDLRGRCAALREHGVQHARLPEPRTGRVARIAHAVGEAEEQVRAARPGDRGDGDGFIITQAERRRLGRESLVSPVRADHERMRMSEVREAQLGVAWIDHRVAHGEEHVGTLAGSVVRCAWIAAALMARAMINAA